MANLNISQHAMLTGIRGDVLIQTVLYVVSPYEQSVLSFQLTYHNLPKGAD